MYVDTITQEERLAELDADVFVPLLRLTAAEVWAEFDAALRRAVDGLDVEVVVPPVKGVARAKEKVVEYRKKGRGEWPFVSNLGDLLRASVVCRRPEHVLRAWQGISAPGSGFTVQRLKNNMDTAKPIPPDMLLNALFAVEGHAPVVVEVQIHLEHILHIKEEEQHFVYELCRAKSIEPIVETARKHTEHRKAAAASAEVSAAFAFGGSAAHRGGSAQQTK